MLDDYLNLGHMDRAVRYCVVVIQIAEGTVLPNVELESPLVRAVTEAPFDHRVDPSPHRVRRAFGSADRARRGSAARGPSVRALAVGS